MVVLSTASKTFFAALSCAGLPAFLYRYGQVKERERHLPSKALSLFKGKSQQQRIIVIGGGVVGVTAAYKLALKGHTVVVLEPNPRPAAECSACAAGGMQRSNPTVDRDSWIAVLKCIAPQLAQLVFGGKEERFNFFHISWFNTLSDPFFLRWVLTFTKTSLFPGQHQHDKQLEMLKFTKFAVDDMVKMMVDAKDNMAHKSGYNDRGSLSLSYEEQEVASVSKAAANLTSSKILYEPAERIVGEEIVRTEPSVRFQERMPTAANYQFQAKSASCERFTEELAARCSQDPDLDVTFLYDTAVRAITCQEDPTYGNSKTRISELKTNRGVISVPEDVKVVVAAGSWTPQVLALMDLYVPVYPLKGYAMSVSAAEALNSNTCQLKPQDLPSRIVSDKYMFTSRLGDDEIRITSIGEFSGWSTQPTRHVDAEFRREAVRQFPQLQELIERAPTRCGLRPYVNDGILLLGAVDTHENLFVSCGPGSNGWKLAMGSGEVIEQLVAGQSLEQIKQNLGFNVAAFSPAGRVLKAPFFAKLCRARWYF
jgi:D-amino-acid dehydrogenase